MTSRREWGHRDIPDGLHPGKGGLSNNLYDASGALVTQSEFHAAPPGERPSSASTGSPWAKLATQFLVRCASRLMEDGARWVAKRAKQAINERLARTRAADAATDATADNSDVPGEQDVAVGGSEADAQDALIEEVEAQAREARRAMADYNRRRHVNESLKTTPERQLNRKQHRTRG